MAGKNIFPIDLADIVLIKEKKGNRK